MARYVVLYHELPPERARAAHWDLMFEYDGALRTWAVEREPVVGSKMWAQALADHRLAYLDYEGPVSGNRGTVSQWDAGTYELRHDGKERWEAVLDGRRLTGTVRLELKSELPHDAPERHFWRVSFSAAPISG